MVLPMVYIHIPGLGMFGFQIEGTTIKGSKIYEYIAKMIGIQRHRIILYHGAQYIRDTMKIKKKSHIIAMYDMRKGIYVKWRDEWIGENYGSGYHNFYRDVKSIDKVSDLKKEISEYLKITDELELIYLESQREIDENLYVMDVFGSLGRDIIVRLKYEKYVNIKFEYSMLSNFTEIMESGEYYKGHKKIKVKQYSKTGDVIKKEKARVERSNQDEYIVYFMKYNSEIYEFVEKYPKFKWLLSYDLYKVKFWSECGSSSDCAFCFRLKSKMR